MAEQKRKFRFRLRLIVADEYQPLRTVPWWLWLLLFAALAAQVGFARFVLPPPEAKAEALPPAPSANALRMSALGDPAMLARVLMISLQGYDNQRGVSVPFRDLDYDLLGEWLDGIVSLDERAEYPHFSASKIYALVKDEKRQRKIIEWVRRQFLRDPNNRWEWMGYATNLAQHVIKDEALALEMAQELRENTTPGEVPAWTRQLEIFFRENASEYDAAAEMMSRQLLDGEITEPHDFVFSYQRLEGMLKEMAERGEIRSSQEMAEKLKRLESLRDEYLAQFELKE